MKKLHKEYLSKINSIKPDVLLIRTVKSFSRLNLDNRLGVFEDKEGIATGPMSGKGITNGVELTINSTSSTELDDLLDNLLSTNSQIQILLMSRLSNLVKIPENIRDLRKLRFLELEGCNILALPDFLPDLPLEYLDLRGNLGLNIPPEILDDYLNPKKILSYYFTGIKGSRKSWLQAKLLVVGQGSVGKTCVIERILNGTYNKNQNKTEGISINEWTINDEKLGTQKKPSQLPLPIHRSAIKLNMWDFGGQEIMHATHQFFLTKRSLYLLVLDSRLTQEENRVEYWLKIIQSFGDQSPILIVGNKIDQHPLDIDHTGLQKKYPNIVGILETSAATGAGIEDLKAAITEQVNNMPHVRDLLPEAWFVVKTKLEELGKQSNFITHDKYLELCNENEVNDETSQHTLIGFLHDLGLILYFQDDYRLSELGILSPQWVINGVYKIINSPALFHNKGILTVSMLDEILNLPEYPRSKRLSIVDLMKRFELCYDLEHDKSFLVPDLLSKDKPAELQFVGIPAFEYVYPVFTSKIITRFIVRMNQKIDNGLVWRTGVVLKIGENKAFVRANIEDRKITIAIDGLEHTRRDALSAIRYQLDEIHNSIKGLEPQKRVPIPEAPNAEPIEYDYLLMLERDGQETYLAKDNTRLIKVNIRELLSGIENESQRRESYGNITNIYVGGDVSGSIAVGDDITITNIKTKFKSIYRVIEESSREDIEKAEITSQVKEIERETAKGEKANESFMSTRLRNLKKAAPDIADVVLAAFTGPVAAVSTIAKKVAKKIKDETK